VNEAPLNETPVAAVENQNAAAPTSVPMRRNSQPLLIALAAWLVPGLGHFLLGRTGRAILFFIAVGGLAMTGFQMRGNVFSSHYSDLFGMVGYLTDMASGVFYLLARLVERAGPDVSRAAGDYGTRFIATAGVVNLVAVIDAYEIAAGRRS
jgi:TM2 domain-containing membrane protein YozV